MVEFSRKSRQIKANFCISQHTEVLAIRTRRLLGIKGEMVTFFNLTDELSTHTHLQYFMHVYLYKFRKAFEPSREFFSFTKAQ